jgi:hypothetical protein
MMTLTIPKNIITNDDIILIPRKEYDKLSRIANLVSEDQLWFWTKDWQEREMQAEEDVKGKKVSGPFKNKFELKKRLNTLKVKK